MTRPPEKAASVDDRIRQVRDGLLHLLSQTGNKHLWEECWPRWDRVMDGLREQVRRPPEVSVSLVGGTGAGKTTLINALLGWRLLPTKEGQPCTSAVCEIAHSDDGGFHAEVEFVTRDEWDAEARRLRADLAASLPVAGESDEDRKVSAALTKAALQKLRAVYKLGEEAGPEQVVGADLPEPEAVKRALSAGAETLSYGPDAADKFADHVKLFLAADQTFWPIVRAVRVRGPFDALRGGLRLIDLPGVNDPSEAREQILRQKLKDCKFVWLVFGIKRALTRDVVELMQGEDFFRQLILDGRTDRLTFVGTHSDDVNFEEACKQYQLPEAPRSRTSCPPGRRPSRMRSSTPSPTSRTGWPSRAARTGRRPTPWPAASPGSPSSRCRPGTT